MKKDTSKKYAIIAGLLLLIPTLMTLVILFAENSIYDESVGVLPSVIVLIDGLMTVAFSITVLIYKKKAALIVTGLTVMLHIFRLFKGVHGFSASVFLGIFAYLVLLWLFMVSSLPKFKKYTGTLKSLWYVPFALFVIESFASVGEQIVFYSEVGDSLAVTMALFMGIFSGVVYSVPYLFVGLWLYKGYKNEQLLQQSACFSVNAENFPQPMENREEKGELL